LQDGGGDQGFGDAVNVKRGVRSQSGCLRQIAESNALYKRGLPVKENGDGCARRVCIEQGLAYHSFQLLPQFRICRQTGISHNSSIRSIPSPIRMN
jgi:hypothetical protein